MTALLDQADLTWTHTAPLIAERRRGVPAVLFVAGMTAATCTVGVPAMVTDLTSITAIPASHVVSEALTADHNIGAQVRELKLASGLTWAQFAARLRRHPPRRALLGRRRKISADHLVRVERIRECSSVWGEPLQRRLGQHCSASVAPGGRPSPCSWPR